MTTDIWTVLARVIEINISTDTWIVFFVVCTAVMFAIVVYNMMR